MIDLQTMMTVKRAIDAYRARDYDALAAMVTPYLPALPRDGQPRTDCALRRAYEHLIASADFPAHLGVTARRYVSEASDAQLLTMADTIIAIGAALHDARAEFVA